MYIDENKKGPSPTDKHTYIKYVGAWLNMQWCNYNENIGSLNSKTINKIWTDFIETYKQYVLYNKKKYD